MGSEPRIDAVLQERFGLKSFRKGQREVIDALLSKHAALAVFPTGGGKSLCYQLPALLLEGVTLVVSPLIALMKDQIDALAARKIAAARLDSTLGEDEYREVMRRIRPGGDLKLLYVAPERFNNERFLATLSELRISLLAIDEAHCVSEWGHNFRPDYLKLPELARSLKVERLLALTATATPAVAKDICAQFRIPPECAIVTGFHRPNLAMGVTAAEGRDRDEALLQKVKANPPGPAIVYVTLQKTAERVAEHLAKAGLPARAYHAGLESELREQVQQWWMASDRNIVVATIAFGMGIDKADVRYVFHYNLPKSLESYSQEIGRAGRDGLPSAVEVLASAGDVPVLENFAYGDTPDPESLRALVDEILSSGTEIEVAQQELSGRLDIRPLVLRTALTYLELEGVLAQGTPYYRAYEVRPLVPVDEIVARFSGERGEFVASLFASAKKGRTWYTLAPEEVSRKLKADRQRIVKALDYLHDQGLAEVRASEVRSRYRRLRPKEDAAALATSLAARFSSREQAEIARIQGVLALLTHAGCLTNALLAHFGDLRTEPCGSCTFCRTGRRLTLPKRSGDGALGESFTVPGLEALRAKHPEALGRPRQAARFLCGLSSPAISRARLGRHELFGSLEEASFAAVLRWCDEGRAK